MSDLLGKDLKRLFVVLKTCRHLPPHAQRYFIVAFGHRFEFRIQSSTHCLTCLLPLMVFANKRLEP